MWPSRICFVFINLLFIVFSAFLVIIGTIIQTSLNGNYGFFKGHLSTAAALTITFGVLLFLTAILALLSVCYKTRILFFAHVFALVILVVIELSAGIAGFVTKSSLLKVITDDLRSAESKYTTNRLVNTTWDSLQKDLNCCGIDHYEEWFEYLGNFSLPDSCCDRYTVGCGSKIILTGKFYQDNCAEAIASWTDRNEIEIVIFYSGLVTMHLLCLLCLQRHMKAPRFYDSVLDDL